MPQGHHAIGQLQQLQHLFRVARELFQGLEAFVGMGDLDQLDFVELVLANQATHILTVGAGLCPETRRECRIAQGKIVFFEDLLTVQIGQGHLGGGNQEESLGLDPEQVLLEFWQLPGAFEGRTVDHQRREHFGIAVLVGVQVGHEVDQRPLEASAQPLVDREPGTGQFSAALKIPGCRARAPRSQWALGSNSKVLGSPTLRSSRLADSSAPSGTEASGTLGKLRLYLHKLPIHLFETRGQRLDTRFELSHLGDLGGRITTLALDLADGFTGLVSERCLSSSISTKPERRSASRVSQRSNWVTSKPRLLRSARARSDSLRRRSLDNMASGAYPRASTTVNAQSRANSATLTRSALRPGFGGKIGSPMSTAHTPETRGPRPMIFRLPTVASARLAGALWPALGAGAAMATFGFWLRDPGPRPETFFLAACTTIILALAGLSLAGPPASSRRAWLAGAGVACMLTAWTMHYGAHRGGVISVILLLVLVSGLLELWRTETASFPRLVPWTLGWQALTHGELLLSLYSHTLNPPHTLWFLLGLPLVAAAVLRALVLTLGTSIALSLACLAAAVGPGWTPVSVTVLITAGVLGLSAAEVAERFRDQRP